MTFDDWYNKITLELYEKGFFAEPYVGFPLVKEPLNPVQRLTLLNLKFSFPTEMRIYDEGVLFIPKELYKHE